jgi:23S rRNA pseudouridine1911/1915/1917 synthase
MMGLDWLLVVPTCICTMNGGDIPETQAAVDLREATLPADAAGWRLDRALAVAIPTLSRERLKGLVSAGAVTVGGDVKRDPALKVKGGEAVVVDIPAPRPSEAVAEDIPLSILFEDEHLLIVDKPAGLVVHPAAGNLDGTLVNALLHHCAGRLSGIGGVARPGIVHRIDKDTSGLLVVAKTDRAHAGLAAQFAKHTIGRRYLAVVAGLPTPPAGRVETNLARSDANRQKIAVVRAPKGQARHHALPGAGSPEGCGAGRVQAGDGADAPGAGAYGASGASADRRPGLWPGADGRAVQDAGVSPAGAACRVA